MTFFSRIKIRSKILAVMTLIVMSNSIAFSVIYLTSQKNALLTSIDSKLLASARSAEYVLPENYHDRIVDEYSISKDDFEVIVDKNNKICLKLNLQYIWSVMVIDNQTVFTSATSPSKDVNKGDHASFFEVHTNPDAFNKAFSTMKVHYSSFRNKWGSGRMVLVPDYDSTGRRYLFGASMNIRDVNQMVNKSIKNSLMISIAVFLFGILLSFRLADSFSNPIVNLTKIAENIAKGNYDHKIDTQGSSELESLSGSLNYMKRAISDKISELNSKNDELEVEINERKQAEEALLESESLIRNVTDNIPMVIYEFYAKPDNVYGLNYVSGRAEELFSISNEPEGFFERFVGRIPTKEEQEAFIASIDEVVKNLEHWDYTTRFKKPNGEIILVQGNSSPEKRGDEIVYRGMLSDVTDRIKAEEENRSLQAQLQRSQKMESMGLLAGGVAHDLNNVLSGIVSYPELLLLDLPEDSPLRKPIETIRESGLRAAAIVQDLLTVARGVATTKEPLILNELVSDYLNSPEFRKLGQFRPTVTVKTNLDSDLFNVSGSHVHIRKVVMNLVSNASEAIEGSGNVTISTVNRYIDRPLSGYDDVTIGEYAILAVSDDGLGISSDDLERIFEPFYTKKVMGRSGTGLGLAVVWNVVQDHKGYIDVTTDVNGTTFELYFPITRDAISDKDLSIPIKDFKGDGETILVVDDVESQREISCKMLDTLGYKTKAVSSGEEAVEYLKEHTVDLILLDMIMDPGINGRETYERIIKIHPNQKAIIVSGFAETDDVKAAQRLGAGQYIKKPVTLEKIGLAIKEELDPAPSTFKKVDILNKNSRE